MIKTSNKLTEIQPELLKSLKHITDEKQLNEVKSLLNFYFRKKLGEAIKREEKDRNFTATVYEEWSTNSTQKVIK